MPPTNYDTSEAPRQWWDDLRGDDAALADLALDRLVRHYQGLVEGAAWKFKTTLPSYIAAEDLLSYGQIGLLKAIHRYDPAAGPFRKFASVAVRGAILDELRSQDWAPRNLRRDQRQVRKATASLRDAIGTPNLGEVAATLGWDAVRLESTMRRVANSHHQTLEGVDQLHDLHTDPEGASQTQVLMRAFVETMETLPTVSQYILAKVYFDNTTLTEVAEDLGIPLNTVRKLHAEAVGAVYEQVYSAASFVDS